MLSLSVFLSSPPHHLAPPQPVYFLCIRSYNNETTGGTGYASLPSIVLILLLRCPQSRVIRRKALVKVYIVKSAKLLIFIYLIVKV